MDATTLQLTWFVLLGVLMAGYAILDGFDLGVGILHLFARNDTERRIFMGSIGPIWDGNEVWLVVFGGATFAAFPNAYAAAFSGFYLGFMLLLCCLIFRAVAMEFRSKRPSRLWRGSWDVAFSAASALATFLFGVVVGDCMQGLPLGADGDFTRPLYLTDLLNPYSILTGLFAVSAFAMHGAIYLYLKTEGQLQARIKGWMWKTFFLFLAAYLVLSAWTLIAQPDSTASFARHPWLWAVPVLNVLAIANVPRAIYHGRPFDAFLSSAAAIAAFTLLFGAALFPNLIVSSEGAAYSLTVSRAASGEKTLEIILAVAALGMPFVLAYTAAVYWVFRGKVKINPASY
jgi:cytochrome bd ubiquinol oxidase subunit II